MNALFDALPGSVVVAVARQLGCVVNVLTAEARGVARRFQEFSDGISDLTFIVVHLSAIDSKVAGLFVTCVSALLC